MAYNPTLGRWMQQDPMGYVDGMDLYQHELARPVSVSDPWGLEAVINPVRSDDPNDFKGGKPGETTFDGGSMEVTVEKKGDKWCVTSVSDRTTITERTPSLEALAKKQGTTAKNLSEEDRKSFERFLEGVQRWEDKNANSIKQAMDSSMPTAERAITKISADTAEDIKAQAQREFDSALNNAKQKALVRLNEDRKANKHGQ